MLRLRPLDIARNHRHVSCLLNHHLHQDHHIVTITTIIFLFFKWPWVSQLLLAIFLCVFSRRSSGDIWHICRYFTGWVSFLPLNWQCQSVAGNSRHWKSPTILILAQTITSHHISTTS